MNFLVDCVNFLNKENEACRKEFKKILYSQESDQLQEGTCIVGAKPLKDGWFSYNAQFVKIKEESKIYFYNSDKQKVGKGEVVEVDFLGHKIKIDLEYFKSNEDKFLLIQENSIYPKNIVDSLTNMSQEPLPLLIERIINRQSNIKAMKELSVENVIKTANEMDHSFMVLHGAPGAGKTYIGKHVIADLLKKGKKIMVTSNSHSAINNLINAIEIKDFKGAKICSRPKQHSEHKSIKNIYVSGSEIDSQVSDYQLVAGTCFSLSRIKELKFDYLIVDEASQIKLSYVLSILKNVSNVIVMGDHLQLTSISPIALEPCGDAILNYILESHQILPQKYGYFLNKTYRCEPQIAKVVSDVFYEGKLKWNKTKKEDGVKLVLSKHTTGQQTSKEEALDIKKIILSLKKKKVKSEEIIVIAPYNAQVSLIKSIIKDDKIKVSTIDLFQGQEADYAIISMVSAGNKKNSAEFVSNKNRLNVALSRAKKGCFIISCAGLVNSKFISESFKKVLKLIS